MNIIKCKAFFMKKKTDQMNFIKRSLLNPLFVQTILITPLSFLVIFPLQTNLNAEYLLLKS